MNVFRGMHFQGSPHSLAKVVSIIQGNAIDYLLDIRRSSPTFGSLQIVELNENLPVSIYIPDGIAHGYLSISNDTIISYMFDGVFCENCDTGISGLDIEEFLPIGFGETLRSIRDQELPDFKSFSYKSKCKS